MAQIEIKKLKSDEQIQKEQLVVWLLGELNNSNIEERNKALQKLLAMPKEDFLKNDLARIAICGNKNYENFAILFIGKHY